MHHIIITHWSKFICIKVISTCYCHQKGETQKINRTPLLPSERSNDTLGWSTIIHTIRPPSPIHIRNLCLPSRLNSNWEAHNTNPRLSTKLSQTHHLFTWINKTKFHIPQIHNSLFTKSSDSTSLLCPYGDLEYRSSFLAWTLAQRTKLNEQPSSLRHGILETKDPCLSTPFKIPTSMFARTKTLFSSPLTVPFQKPKKNNPHPLYSSSP